MLPIPQSNDSSKESPEPKTGEFVLNPPIPTPKHLLKPDISKTGTSSENTFDFSDYNHAVTVHMKNERLSLFVTELAN